jgi:hypothetical protein
MKLKSGFESGPDQICTGSDSRQGTTSVAPQILQKQGGGFSP